MRLFNLIREPDGQSVSKTEKALALSIAGVVNTLLSLLLSMASARVLTKAEIAVNSQTLLAYTTFASFLTLGITSGIYYHLANNEDRKRAVVNESMTLIALASLVYALFILFGGNRLLAVVFKNPAIENLLYFIIPYALIITPTSVLSCVCVYENRLRWNAILSTARTFLTLLIVSAVMLIYRTGASMVVSRVAVSIGFALFSVFLTYGYILPRDDAAPKWGSMKRLLAISVPLGVASMIGTISLSLDKWIVSAMLNPETFAVYTKGAYELPFISTITGAIGTVILVDMTKAAKAGDYDTALSLFRHAAEKTSLLLLPLMVLCLSLARPLILFLFTDAFVDAIPIFMVYLLYIPVRTVYYGPLMIAMGKSKAVMWRSVAGLTANAVLSVLLVRWMGAVGATVATIITVYLVSVPINMYVICRKTQAKWYRILPLGRYGLCLLLSLPGAAACVLLNRFVLFGYLPIIQLCGGGLAFAAITIPLLCWRFHISPRDIVRAALKKRAKGRQ